MRSMSAEYFFKAYQQDKPHRYSVASAGTRGNPLGPFPETLRVLKNTYGIDASSHISRALTQQLIDNATHIICFSQHHRTFITKHYGKESFLFNELAVGEYTDIQDDTEAHITELDARFPSFITHLLSIIHQRIPSVYEKLQNQ